MQLTTQRLKQIIKEELEAIVSEMSDEETELSAEEQEVASLEQQLAEAKDKAKKAAMKGKEAAMKGKEKPQGKRGKTVAPAATPMKAKNVGNLYGKGATKMSTKK